MLREESYQPLWSTFSEQTLTLTLHFSCLILLLCVYYGIKWAKHVITIDPHRIDCCVSVSCRRGNTVSAFVTRDQKVFVLAFLFRAKTTSLIYF